jgi:hypothetical protein
MRARCMEPRWAPDHAPQTTHLCDLLSSGVRSLLLTLALRCLSSPPRDLERDFDLRRSRLALLLRPLLPLRSRLSFLSFLERSERLDLCL